MRACDDEQGSSSPVRHECNEQGRSARAQGSSPALCRVPRAMNEWAWAKGEPRQSRVGSKRAAPQRALPRTSARSLARSERKLACHERCAQHCSRAQRARTRAHSQHCSRAQRAMSPAQRAMSRAQRAMARAPSERCRAPSERCRARTASDSSRAMSAGARSEHQCVRRLAIGMQQLCDERMGCAHMASNGCVRAAHGRATRRVFALRLKIVLNV